ncbi:MAG: hypothetical protein ABI175_16340 [Polyangiales bacterium]
MHPTARRWLLRTVVVVGATASIATPQKKWSLDAILSADAKDVTRARVLVVTATREPELSVRRGQTWDQIQPRQPAASWPGTVTFDIPAGSDIERLAIAHGCGGGLCSGKCKVPDDEYIRVDRVDLTSWSLESGESSISRTMGKKGPRSVVTVEATREPVIEVTTPSMTYRPMIEKRDYAAGRASFTVDFNTYGGTGEMPVVWSLRARIDGPCTGACTPPVGEHVTILGVADE